MFSYWKKSHKKTSKKSIFFHKKLSFFSEYLETEKNSWKIVLIKQPLTFYARQLCPYELGTENRGFWEKAKNHDFGGDEVQKNANFLKIFTFYTFDYSRHSGWSSGSRHVCKIFGVKIFSKIGKNSHFFRKTEIWPLLPTFCPKSTWRRNWAEKFSKGLFVPLAYGSHMQKFGKIGWLVFEIVTFFKIPNNVFYFEIGRAPTPPKRILLWIDARPPSQVFRLPASVGH